MDEKNIMKMPSKAGVDQILKVLRAQFVMEVLYASVDQFLVVLRAQLKL